MAESDNPMFGGRYELIARFARGGMSEVFLGRDHLLGRQVAVKVLFPEFANDAAFVERFRREAQAAANLSQPNVVGVYDWGNHEGTYYIIMEYVDGRSLAEVLRTEGPLHPNRAADIAAEIATALAFAHERGVIHRDIKPGNVMIAPSGTVKVADFGIARALSSSNDNLTRTGSVMGTATYLSPEQAQGREADGRSDVYSLSVVLYEMLTAGPPFTGDSPVSIAYKHVQEEPTPPSHFNADVPATLEAVCLRGMQKDPARRYATAADMRDDLLRFRAGETVQALSAGPGAYQAVPSAPASQPQPQPQPLASQQTGMPPPGAAPAHPGLYAAVGESAHQGHQAHQAHQGYPPTPGYAPAPAPAAEPPDRTPMWITLLVLLLIVIAGLVFLLVNNSSSPNASNDDPDVSSGQLRIPDVVGMHFEQAERTLADAGFENVKVEFRERDGETENVVFQQNPRAGLLLADPNAPENAITLFAAAPEELAQLPSVIGRTFEEAEQLLLQAGFSVERIDMANQDLETGLVADQSIPSSERRPQGTVVTVTVSSGRGAVEVPLLVGQTLGDARVTLARLGLIERVQREHSTEFPVNSVIRSSPERGEQVERGGVVTLVISEGPDETVVPSLEEIGTTNAAIVQDQLITLGFAVKRAERETDDPDAALNTVVEIDPPAGTTVVSGSEVLIVVLVPPVTATVPTLEELGSYLPGEVEARLRERGFATAQREAIVPLNDIAAGLVITLEPAPGSVVKVNSETVTLVVGKEAQQETPSTTTATTAPSAPTTSSTQPIQ